MGVYKSLDGGVSWVSVGLCDHIVPSLAITGNHTLFAGTMGNGVYRSLDGGSSWTEVNNGLSDLTVEVLCVSPNYVKDQTIFVGTIGGGVFKSTDTGESWQCSGLEGNLIPALDISPSYYIDQTLFAGTWDGVYKSTDGGMTWQLFSYLVRYEDDGDNLILSGEWKSHTHKSCSCSQLAFSKDPGDKVTIPFIGKSVSWIGTRGPNHGIAKVYLDGIEHATVDLYSLRFMTQKVLYTITFPTIGYHQFRVKVTPHTNPYSTGNIITIDAFDIVYNGT